MFLALIFIALIFSFVLSEQLRQLVTQKRNIETIRFYLDIHNFLDFELYLAIIRQPISKLCSTSV